MCVSKIKLGRVIGMRAIFATIEKITLH